MRLRSSLLVLLLAPLASCSFIDKFGGYHATDAAVNDGATDAQTDATTSELTLDTFLPLFFDGLCAKAIRCEAKASIGGLLEIFCNDAAVDIFFSTVFGTLHGFDPVVAQQCLDGLASIDCSLSNTLFVSSCDQFLGGGSVATGQACTGDLSCAAGRCMEIAGSCGDVCVDAGDLGAACVETNSDNDCDSPLHCRAGTCQPSGEIGQVCEKASDCVSLTWCAPGGTCQPLPNSGQTCVTDSTTDYADPCRGSLVCALNPDMTTKSCQAGKTAGQTCSSSVPCAPGHRCESNLCHLISPPGGTCVSKDDCPFAFECVEEICRGLSSVGGPCSPTFPCFQGACVSNVCTLLPDGSTCDGSNGLLGGQCAGFCNNHVSAPYMCVARGGVGATCNNENDDEACQQGLGCEDAGGGTYTCQACN